MRDSITGHVIYNSNKMVRQTGDHRLVVIVESDADISIADNHVAAAAVRLTSGHGKSATLEAARLHRDAGDDWAAAFVDKDFEDEQALEDSNVFCSEMYDLEAEIYFGCHELIERFFRTHCNRDPKEPAVATAKTLVLEIAIAVGTVRAVVVCEGLDVSMARFPIGELTHTKHGSDYLDRVLTISSGKAKLSEADTAVLRERSDALAAGDRDELVLCNGHDLIGAMAIAIERIGKMRPRPTELAAAIHAALSCDCFRTLSFYRKISAWAGSLGAADIWDCDAA